MKRPVRARFGGNRPHTNIRTCMAVLAIPTPPTPLIATIIIFLREYKTYKVIDPSSDEGSLRNNNPCLCT